MKCCPSSPLEDIALINSASLSLLGSKSKPRVCGKFGSSRAIPACIAEATASNSLSSIALSKDARSLRPHLTNLSVLPVSILSRVAGSLTSAPLTSIMAYICRRLRSVLLPLCTVTGVAFLVTKRTSLDVVGLKPVWLGVSLPAKA